MAQKRDGGNVTKEVSKMSEKAPLLRIENIGKDYFGNCVLQDVTFSLKEGEIMGLVGENGAGKSTLMNILFGMPVIHQTGGYTGKIVMDGEEVCFKDPTDALNAGIGMVHQEFSLIPGFSATENILLNRESTKYNPLVEVFGDRLKTLDSDKSDSASAAGPPCSRSITQIAECTCAPH